MSARTASTVSPLGNGTSTGADAASSSACRARNRSCHAASRAAFAIASVFVRAVI
jgi:hypothetical protein